MRYAVWNNKGGTGKSFLSFMLGTELANNSMPLPVIHSVILNRSTQYNKKGSKAFGAMFDAIKTRVHLLRKSGPENFVSGNDLFHEIPDNHSVAIVCSHIGLPLYQVSPGKYEVYDEMPQVNSEPLDRYKDAINKFRAIL